MLEAVLYLVGHKVVKELEVLALFLTQVLLYQVEELRNSFQPAFIIVLKLSPILNLRLLILGFLFFIIFDL